MIVCSPLVDFFLSANRSSSRRLKLCPQCVIFTTFFGAHRVDPAVNASEKSFVRFAPPRLSQNHAWCARMQNYIYGNLAASNLDGVSLVIGYLKKTFKMHCFPGKPMGSGLVDEISKQRRDSWHSMAQESGRRQRDSMGARRGGTYSVSLFCL